MSANVERMSRVDTAWLRMDTEANLMMIVGVWLIEPQLAWPTCASAWRRRCCKYGRFKQKVVEDALGAQWVDDDHFDIAAHVVPEKLELAQGQTPLEALKHYVGDLTTQPLNPSRPLWQFHLFEDFETGRTALVARIHHCIADGIALISVMLSITDGGKSPPRAPQARGRRRRARTTGSPTTCSSRRPTWPSRRSASTARRMGKGIEMMADPRRAAERQHGDGAHRRAGGLGRRRHGADARRLAHQPEGQGHAGQARRMGRAAAAARGQGVGHALGGSINDVLLASVAGAIGSYLRDKGEDPTGKEIRAMVPVNLRPLEKAWQLGNRFGLVPLVLPIGIANPIDRLAAVRARMNELKGGYQPLLAFALLSVAGVLIKPVQHALLDLFAKKATAVMTNVPGPTVPLKLCGRTLKQVMFWVPASGDIGMGVSILSYGGGVQFGLITDAQMCPDPDEIVQRFRPEFDQLLWLAMMLPWEGR